MEGWLAERISRTYGRLDHFVYEETVWTDDTQQALVLVASLARRGTLDPEWIGRRFVEMRRAGARPFGLHRGTGRGFRSAVDAFERSGDPNTSGNADRAGNGAAMRIAPVAASMAEMPEDEFRQGVRHGRCGHGRQRDPRRLEANSLLRGSGRLGPDAGGSREPAQAPDLMEVEKRLCAIVRGSST